MKILLTTHQFFPHYTAGTEVLTYGVARELIARGHEVRILTGYPGRKDLEDDSRFDEYDFEGIRIYRFHHAYIPMAGQNSMVELSYDNRLASQYFESILYKFKPELAHCFHLSRLGTGLIDDAIRNGIPVFMTPVDFWSICHTGQLMLADGRPCAGPTTFAGNCIKHFAQEKGGPIGKIVQFLPDVAADYLGRITQAELLPSYPQKIEVKAIGARLDRNISRLNRLKKIISPNSFMTEKLIQYGIRPELITQSAYGIQVMETGEKSYRTIPRSPFRIGFIGTLAAHKGCHVLINAFQLLPQEKAHLKIYGDMEDSAYVMSLKKLAEDNQAIEFCGTFNNTDINKVFSELDVLVVPSIWYENTPLVIYSAQAAGCPVIASDFPGISEVIKNEVNGLLFKAGDPKALARQLRRFIDQEPNLLSQLSKNSTSPKSITTYVDELLSIWAE